MAKLKDQYSADEFRKLFTQKGNSLKRKEERDIQRELCDWIASEYPNALFLSDIAGTNLAAQDRCVFKLRSRGENDKALKFPDLLIFNPCGAFVGLALELKNDGVVITNKDGTLKNNPHFQGQYRVLQLLRSFGWAACFAVGLNKAKELICTYFNCEPLQWEL